MAVEFCYRYGRFFHGVHWIQADHDIDTEIAVCGSKMDLSPWPDDLSERVSLTLQAWKEVGPRLVIFDNVVDPVSVQDWLPEMPTGRMLLTSRSSDWPPALGIQPLPIDVMTRQESLELLRSLAKRLKDSPDADLEMIAERLGDLPLALDLAGNYLEKRPTLSPAGYLAELDKAGRSLLDHSAFGDWIKHNPTKHSTSLIYTFALSWNQLTKDKTDEMARRVFQACGYCAPNTPIPWELLAKTVGAEDTSQQQNLDLALDRLRGLGLITPEERGSSIIHPLMAEFARMQDLDTEASALPDLARALGNMASDANKTGLPEAMMPLREHLRAVAMAAEAAELDTGGWLWNELGYHLRVVADYKGAKEHYERVLKVSETVYGSDHPKMAIRANNLGRVLWEMGDYEGAKKLFKRALEIDEKALGPDHPNVAINVNNLGSVLQDMGDLQSAKERFERALEIDEEVYGPDHPDVAIRVNNLGSVLKDMGNLQGAKEHFERALKIGEAVYSSDHPQVAVYANNLGLVLEDMGDQSEPRWMPGLRRWGAR